MAKGKKRQDDPAQEPENFTALNAFMAKFIKDVTKSIEDMESSKQQPMIYGFNIRIDQNGVPVIDRFGNINKSEPNAQCNREREPLVDIIESEMELIVVVELPGVGKEQIKLESDQAALRIDAKSINRSYHKEIRLTKPVDPLSAKAKYNNGVLEVTFRKAASGGKSRSIRIE
jgi:HSP20 family protein